MRSLTTLPLPRLTVLAGLTLAFVACDRGCQGDGGTTKSGGDSGEAGDVAHDTKGAFNPGITVGYDPDTPRPKRVTKKLRIKRYRNGRKEVIYLEPKPPKTFPLDPLAAAARTDAGVTVSAYGHTVSRSADGGPGDGPTDPGPFYGRMILFCVDDCPDATFFQFVKLSFAFSIAGEPPHAPTTWGYDTLDGKPGQYGNLPDPGIASGVAPEPAMYDAPGFWVKPALQQNPPHAGDTQAITEQFETFVCCDHSLIGYWSWQQTLTYTWQKDSTWSDPSVDAAPPAWNPDPATGGDPAQMLGKDKRCQ